MNKKNGMRHVAVIFFLAVFVILGLASASKPAAPIQTETGSSTSYSIMTNSGSIQQAALPVKDFTSMGLIFVESTAVLDSKDNIIEGSKITYDMMMKAAQKVGADDIINLRIDEIRKITTTEQINFITGKDVNGKTTSKQEKVLVTTTTVDYKASALAIKYTGR